MSKTKGRVTLPSESNFLDETKELLERWGADAIRDSDGTKLDRDIKSLDAKIYTTYFVARGHNEFAREHMDECQQLYLRNGGKSWTGPRGRRCLLGNGICPWREIRLRPAAGQGKAGS